MRQIYINTMLGTTRIDYDETDPSDIFIVATTCTVDQVFREAIECTSIKPEDIEWFNTKTGRTTPLVKQ